MRVEVQVRCGSDATRRVERARFVDARRSRQCHFLLCAPHSPAQQRRRPPERRRRPLSSHRPHLRLRRTYVKMAPPSSHQHPPSRALVVSTMVVCASWHVSDPLHRLARCPSTWSLHWLYVIHAYMRLGCLTDSWDWHGRRIRWSWREYSSLFSALRCDMSRCVPVYPLHYTRYVEECETSGVAPSLVACGLLRSNDVLAATQASMLTICAETNGSSIPPILLYSSSFPSS